MDKKKELGLEKISETKEKLMGWACAEIDCGMAGANIEKLGEVVDMIKDLAEAEMYCVEAEEKKMKKKYYCTLIREMHGDFDDAEDMDEEEMMHHVMGYNRNRYSSGRYAPSGHGDTTAGYSMRGGRHITGGTSPNQNMSAGRTMGYPMPMIPMEYDEYGVPKYDKLGKGPWYYHEGEEKEMSQKDQMHHAMDTVKEMWHEADPELKREMKKDMSNLVNDIPV